MKFAPPILSFFGVFSLSSFSWGEIVVENLADDGPGSLREAVRAAEEDEVIVFDPVLSGQTVTLTSGQIFIAESLTIDASALERALVIDGAQSSRIFRVSSGAGVILRSLELVNGWDRGGGAIFHGGFLACENCTFRGNISTGNTGESGFGGAIFSSGPLSLTNCTLTQNLGDRAGGAIHLDGATATLVHCTVVHNGVERVADRSGGFDPGPGGLSFRPEFGTVGGYRLFNSIVCQNFNEFENERLEDQNFDRDSLLNPEQGGNLIDEDPLLAPLGFYGGAVSTMMPLSLSPAINAGTDEGIAIDQRGALRPVGATVDIGAVETGALPLFDVAVLDDPVVSLAGDRREFAGSPAGLSLREAIVRARPGATMTFAPELAGQTLVLELGELVLRRDLEIRGDGLASPVTISGTGQSRVFFVESGARVTMAKLTISNGVVGEGVPDRENFLLGGGGIFNAGQLRISGCLLDNNRGQQGGGLTSRIGSHCEVEHSTFRNNEALIEGGGACLRGEVQVIGSTFENNRAEGQGGGLYLSGFNSFGPEVSNSTFVGNEASSGGGVAANDHHLLHCTIAGNTASSSAGGLLVRSPFPPALDLHSCIVATNEAPEVADLDLSRVDLSSHNLVGVDPQLGPLQDNGGPTETMMPAAGSPAVDPEGGRVGEDFETDQRGFFRTANGVADIGAVEFGSEAFPERMTQPVVTSGIDQFRQTTVVDPADLTLREAIAYSAPGAVVTFAEDLTGSRLVLTGGEIEIGHSLTVDGGQLGGRVCLDAASTARHFRVPGGRTLTVRNLCFENGRREEPADPVFSFQDVDDVIRDELAGGAIFAVGPLVLDHCEFRQCTSKINGGAIGSVGGLEVTNSVFENCLAGQEGGAVWAYAEGGAIVLRGSRFGENESGLAGERGSFARGGAVSLVLERSPCLIDECYFHQNKADSAGALLLASRR